MANRITFEEFQARLEAHELTQEMYGEYLEFDPNSAIPKIRFKPDSLLDSPPQDYDIDDAIYRAQRELAEREEEIEEGIFDDDRPRVVAEGDSWFNLPPIIRPNAIADRMKKNGNYKVKNIAKWGHTIKDILDEQEYIAAIGKKETAFFLISAGGNDMQDNLAAGGMIYDYDENRALNDYLTDDGVAVLNGIADDYKTLISDVLNQYPDMKIVCHAYDYPRPLLEGGKYIGKYLHAKGIADDKKQQVIDPIVDKLNTLISQVTGQYPNVHYLDMRTVTEPYTWYDDMHPKTEGFKKLTELFEIKMGQI